MINLCGSNTEETPDKRPIRMPKTIAEKQNEEAEWEPWWKQFEEPQTFRERV
jgi:hypothetical protein